MEGTTTKVFVRKVIMDAAESEVSREELKKLWKAGLICGLFNIPFDNEELFNSCHDFCLEVDPKEEKLYSIAKLEELQRKYQSMQASNGDILKQVVQLKEMVAKNMSEELTKQEERTNKQTSLKKNLEQEKKKFSDLAKKSQKQQEKWQQHNEEITKLHDDLKKKNQKMENELEMQKQRNMQMESQLVQLRENFDKIMEKQDSQERILEENEKIKKENLKLQKALKKQIKLVKEISEENKQLGVLKDNILIEHQKLKDSMYFHSQNDHLNKKIVAKLH